MKFRFYFFLIISSLIFSCFLESQAFSRDSKEKKIMLRAAYWGLISDLYMIQMRCATDLHCVESSKVFQLSVKDRVTKISIKTSSDLEFAQALDNLTKAFQPPKSTNLEVSRLADALMDHLLRYLDKSTGPVAVPNFDLGQRDFETYCSDCHSKSGGSLRKLTPKMRNIPRPFDEGWRRAHMSPLITYATMVSGISSSEMMAFRDVLDEDQLWNIAFYIATIRHASALLSSDVCNQSIDLKTMLMASDDDLLKSVPATDKCNDPVAFIRNKLSYSKATGRETTLQFSLKDLSKPAYKGLWLMAISIILVSAGFYFLLKRR